MDTNRPIDLEGPNWSDVGSTTTRNEKLKAWHEDVKWAPRKVTPYAPNAPTAMEAHTNFTLGEPTWQPDAVWDTPYAPKALEVESIGAEGALGSPCAKSAARKAAPVDSGFLKYFPDAIMEVSRLSKSGNDKHNPGLPLQWSKGKSNDHGDCLVRHQMEVGTIDTDTGFDHAVAVAWRAMAQLQILLEEREDV